MLLSALTGCVGPLLEAPYVLATGTGAAQSISISAHNRLFVASDEGLLEVDGEGRVTPLHPNRFSAVSTHPDRLWAVDARGLHSGPLPPPGGKAAMSLAHPMTGLTDVLATCEDTVLVVQDEKVMAWPPGGPMQPWATAPGPIAGLAIGRECGAVVAWGPQWLGWLEPSGFRPVGTPTDTPRSAAHWSDSVLLAITGTPPQLMVVENGEMRVLARHLDRPTDLHRGNGGLLHPANLYMSDAGGSVDYIRLPEVPQ